ncbi:MAG: HEAT repeat domain-containing protein [Elusimicrobiota bacterium]
MVNEIGNFYKHVVIFSIICPVFILTYPQTGMSSEPTQEETLFHYQLARDAVNNNRFIEAKRELHEIIDYYDPMGIEAYGLLISVYQNLGDKENTKNIEEQYEKVKAIKAGKPMGTTPEELLANGLPKQKIDACRMLGKSKDEKSLELLIKALADPYYNHYSATYDVREVAADNIAAYGDQAVTVLVKAFINDNPGLRWWCLETLRRIKPVDEQVKGSIAKLYMSALKDTSWNVRRTALSAIAEIKMVSAVAEIVPLFTDDNDEVRLQAVMAVDTLQDGLTKSTAAVDDALIKLLEDKNNSVVNQAIKTVIRVGDKKSIIPRLRIIAEDNTKEVLTRWYAIKGLGELLSEKKDLAELKKFLTHEDFWLRSAAATALGEEDTAAQKDLLNETAVRFSIESPDVYEEARVYSLEKALKFLESVQKEDGSFPSIYVLGTTELAALCFLNHGYTEETPVLNKAVKFILNNRKDDGTFLLETSQEGKDKKLAFTTGLAIEVLAKTGNSKYKGIIKDSVEWLKSIQNTDGGFGYYKGSRSDMTATRFALAGLNAGYDYWGYPKTDEAWIKAVNYLKSVQNTDGGFGYTKDFRRDSYGSATADGLINLLVTGSIADTVLPEKALEWIQKNYGWEANPFDPNPNHYEYYVVALARAFDLAKKEVVIDGDGVKHYWYDEVTKKLLTEQNKDGSWKVAQEPLFTTYFVEVMQLRHARKSLEGL